MAYNTKKYLDEEGLKQVVRLLDEYPDNQILGTVIDEIQDELDKKADVVSIPEVPVQDVQINDTSLLENGIANIPIANENTLGVVKTSMTQGTMISSDGTISVAPATNSNIKAGTAAYRTLSPYLQHRSTFYGLAKAAGDTTQSQSDNAVGTYTPEAKGAIQKMLGVSDLIATEENNLIASKAYAVGDVFTANGKLYKATAAIAVDGAIITDGANANCEETNVGNIFPHDIQINGTSIINNGVANIPIGTQNTLGAVMPNQYGGIIVNNSGQINIYRATDAEIKAGTNIYKPIVAGNASTAAFYGLAKAAGDATQSASDNAVGTYTYDAQLAIRNMLGVPSYPTASSIKLGNSNTIIVPTSMQHEAVFYGLAKVAGIDLANVNDITLGTYPDNAKTAIRTMLGAVGDVQINGTSVVSNGVAEIPLADHTTFGVAKVSSNLGVNINPEGYLTIGGASSTTIKSGNSSLYPITTIKQHEATFYGLAKAAGDTTQSASSNVVGTYTDEAKAAIQTMLGIDLSSIASQVEIPLVETVTGTDVTINGQPNVRYNCGEVSTITINPPAAGSIDVIFTSGTSVAVLTLPSTVKMPEWFDATALETDTIYEILITDGVYGSVMTWVV